MSEERPNPHKIGTKEWWNFNEDQLKLKRQYNLARLEKAKKAGPEELRRFVNEESKLAHERMQVTFQKNEELLAKIKASLGSEEKPKSREEMRQIVKDNWARMKTARESNPNLFQEDDNNKDVMKAETGFEIANNNT